jgi:hypothetical protein
MWTVWTYTTTEEWNIDSDFKSEKAAWKRWKELKRLGIKAEVEEPYIEPIINWTI